MKDFIISFRFTIVLMLLCCAAYSSVVWGLGQTVFPGKSNGSLITRNNQVIGSQLLGQSFQSAGYFHGRPSAVNYNASGSGGSNLSNGNPALLLRISDSVTSASELDYLSTRTVASDRIYASGSGLDPDITVENAIQQAPRIARERGLSVAKVEEVIAGNTQKPFLALLGTTTVRVLPLNLQLDEISESPGPK